MIGQRCCSIDGKSWSSVVGEITANVWLLTDETTYVASISKVNEYPCWGDTFDCLKTAKAACLEAIDDHEDIKDAEAVLADGSETVPWDEMELKQRIAELEAELARRPVVYIRMFGGKRGESPGGIPVLYIQKEVDRREDIYLFEIYTGEEK